MDPLRVEAARERTTAGEPAARHGLLVEKPGLRHLIITEFLTRDPVQTFAPIRRA